MEDIYRALATQLAVNPLLILAQTRDRDWSVDQIQILANSLPLESVDDSPRRITILRSRLQAVERVNDDSLTREKMATVAALSDYLARLSKSL